jgi:hypothetical protein
MAWKKTTPDKVLLAVEERLIDQIDDASESSTWISTLPDRPEPPQLSSDGGYEISMTGGVFEPAEIGGGGVDSMHVSNCQLIVTIHTIVLLDESSRDKDFLTHREIGVLIRMTKVMKALAAHMLQDGGVDILAQAIYPVQFVIPPHTEKGGGYNSAHFSLEFDWDLT